MAGETELQKLLGSMSPELVAGVFVFTDDSPDNSDTRRAQTRNGLSRREGDALILAEDEVRAAGLASSAARSTHPAEISAGC